MYVYHKIFRVKSKIQSLLTANEYDIKFAVKSV
jgi:hypothetical protein